MSPPHLPQQGPFGEAHFESFPVHILQGPKQSSPPPGSPNRTPIERCSVSRALFYLSVRVASKWTTTAPSPGSPMGPLWREMPLSRAFFYTSRDRRKSHLSVKVPSKGKMLVSRASGSLIYISHAQEENLRSLTTEPHVDRSAYNGAWPGSPRVLFVTLLSLPRCHAALSKIPSPLAWVDQSPISQCVL